jgi:hypothetical protein
MITGIDMITDSLRLINVIRANQSPDAEMGVSSLRALNELMADWQADGIRLGWYPVTDITDELPLAEENERAIKYNLAQELCATYGLDPPPVVVEIAKATYARLAKLALQTFEESLDQLPIPEPWGTIAWPIG